MKPEAARPLAEALAAKKDAIVKEWLARTLQTYPEHTSRFLAQEKDPFRNPIGHTVREALPALFDELLGNMDAARLTPVLDGLVRIRAVQDFSAGQAVAFLFVLKRVLRDAVGGQLQWVPDGEGLAVLEARIDEMALLAFDLFMRCRERLYEIRVNEARRRMVLPERMQRMRTATQARGAGGPT